jgi:hypothetical protein
MPIRRYRGFWALSGFRIPNGSATFIRAVLSPPSGWPSPKQRALYVRWLGRHGQFLDQGAEQFDPAGRLTWWCQRLQHIQTASSTIRDIYCFFDNDFPACRSVRGFARNGTQKGEGFEYHLLALGLAFVVLIHGAGKASIDAEIQSKLGDHDARGATR